MLERHTRCAEDTQAFGAELAHSMPRAPRGDAPLVIYLKGDLGAGKTTLVQGFVRACGVTDAVRSPTYALMEPYEAELGTLLHLDLYRLRDEQELEPLGLRDFAHGGVLWLIEWPDRGRDRLPPPDLIVELSVACDAHRIVAQAHSPVGERWLAAFRSP